MCLNEDGTTRWHICPTCGRQWTNRWFTQCKYPDEQECVECSSKGELEQGDPIKYQEGKNGL